MRALLNISFNPLPKPANMTNTLNGEVSQNVPIDIVAIQTPYNLLIIAVLERI